MSTTLTAIVIALVGVLAVLAVAGAFYLVGRAEDRDREAARRPPEPEPEPEPEPSAEARKRRRPRRGRMPATEVRAVAGGRRRRLTSHGDRKCAGHMPVIGWRQAVIGGCRNRAYLRGPELASER